MYLKRTCHLPFARKGFPAGCGGRWQAECAVAPGILHSVPCMARSGFVYRP